MVDHGRTCMALNTMAPTTRLESETVIPLVTTLFIGTLKC